MRSVETKLRQLPQSLQKEVEDFIDFLLNKRVSKRGCLKIASEFELTV